jgi:hypothetical protein
MFWLRYYAAQFAAAGDPPPAAVARAKALIAEVNKTNIESFNA